MMKTRLLNAEEMAEIYASQATGTLIAERLAEAERRDAEMWERAVLSSGNSALWFIIGCGFAGMIMVALFLWSAT